MSSAGLDRPGRVRPGEELDLAALSAYLAARQPELAGPIELGQFRSGYSNLTYLLRVGEREVVLRRPPTGSAVATAHDVLREHRLLERLHPVYPLAPRPLLACDDPAVLGVPFFLMERVSGMILRRDPPAGVPFGPQLARGFSEQFVDRLVELHQLELEASGLAALGHPDGYVERQLAGWTQRWQRARGERPHRLDATAAWLGEQPFRDRRARLVHNDFKVDNLVLDPAHPARIRAVLDWEMATVGDPLLDLGTTLGYWVEAGDPPAIAAFRFGPTHLPGCFTRQQIAERYATATGCDLSELATFHAFGLFKIAVIAQQIWVRFERGLTRDERFARLPAAVLALAEMAERVRRSA